MIYYPDVTPNGSWADATLKVFSLSLSLSHTHTHTHTHT